jgi:RNA polymerase sigma-70 factor, ECF subfamily
MALMSRVQQGDDQAMAALYDRYSRLVYSVARRILRDPCLAEDVLQDVFLHIWRVPDCYRLAEGNLPGWLATVARNRAIDRLRGVRYTDLIEDWLIPSSYDLEHQAELNLVCERARAVGSALGTEQQMLLDMAFFDGMSHCEIAVATGCPLGTVKSRIRAALILLRKGLQVKGLIPQQFASDAQFAAGKMERDAYSL